MQKAIVLFIFLMILPGCKKEIPNPETLDPIYLDLKKAFETLEKDLENEEKGLIKQKEELDKTPKGTMDYVTAEKGYKKTKRKVKKMRQEVHYLKIRQKRRYVEARRKYKIAFQNGESWPNPKEYENFKLSKKLQETDLNWNKRVPKLDINNPNYKKNQKK